MGKKRSAAEVKSNVSSVFLQLESTAETHWSSEYMSQEKRENNFNHFGQAETLFKCAIVTVLCIMFAL